VSSQDVIPLKLKKHFVLSKTPTTKLEKNLSLKLVLLQILREEVISTVMG
jgi:hypothetical protein